MRKGLESVRRIFLWQEGLNCQAVSDVFGRILDISITYGGSSSDLLVHKASDLCEQLEDGILRPRLVLYGDNACLNSRHMVTPYPNVGNNSLEKSKDNYNFFSFTGKCN